MTEDGPRDLRERNRALDAQVKLLVKSEQRLYRSQRELGQQLRQVAAVNRLALDAAKTDEPCAIAALAFDMLFDIFPYEQGLALVADAEGRVRPLAISAVPGCEHDGSQRLAELRRRELPAFAVPAAPVVVARTADARPEIAPLLALLDDVFASPVDQVADGCALVLPLAIQQRPQRSALLLRRLGRAKSFHEVLPTDKDAPYLTLVAQQVATALGKAELVMSLRQSYAELESTQRELVGRERLAAIGELAAVVAHEVRNPLGAIFNSVAALERTAEPAAEVRVLLDVLGEEARRLNRIVGDLIDFSRPAPASRHEAALAPIVASALESASRDARAHHVDLCLDADEQVRASVDEHLLRRALLNLVDNAIQATGEGGEVSVRVARDEDDVLLEVSDEGHGIPDDQIQRIFEPFFTTKATGTGLGLAVVRRFAEAHGGAIDVRSGIGSGSTFTIRLPARSGER